VPPPPPPLPQPIAVSDNRIDRAEVVSNLNGSVDLFITGKSLLQE
jgi:hypothetical protein